MSRKNFLVILAGSPFLSSGEAFVPNPIEVWLKIYGATTHNQRVALFDNRTSARFDAPVVGQGKKLGEISRAQISGGSVVLFGPLEQDESQMVPKDRRDIELNLHNKHTLTIVVNDGELSLEYEEYK